MQGTYVSTHLLVDDLAVGSDAGVLIDDGGPDDRVAADTDGHPSRDLSHLDLGLGLVVVSAHDHRVTDVASVVVVRSCHKG